MCSYIQCGSMALYGALRIQINQTHILYIHFHYLDVRLISKFHPPPQKTKFHLHKFIYSMIII